MKCKCGTRISSTARVRIDRCARCCRLQRENRIKALEDKAKGRVSEDQSKDR